MEMMKQVARAIQQAEIDYEGSAVTGWFVDWDKWEPGPRLEMMSRAAIEAMREWQREFAERAEKAMEENRAQLPGAGQ